jgi:glutamine amidotransferase
VVSILNYGLANLRSVQKAFEQIGVDASIITTPDQVRSSGHLVVPGVGAVADAIAHIRERGLDTAIADHIGAGKPFLGICLGLQMLFERCHEGGLHAGLGILAGDCIRLTVDQTHGLKVPHMGWNTLDILRPSPLLRGLDARSHAYFVHSYHVVPTDPSVIASTSSYGIPLVSSIWRDNVVACQFHPEKSQQVGLTILRNFAAM